MSLINCLCKTQIAFPEIETRENLTKLKKVDFFQTVTSITQAVKTMEHLEDVELVRISFFYVLKHHAALMPNTAHSIDLATVKS